MSLEFDIELKRRDFNLKLDGSFDSGITGIFGSSGAGKTTFFNILAGLEKPDKGSISLHRKVLTDTDKKVDIPVHKRRIGFVFQDNLLFPHLTIKENLLFGKPYVKKERIFLKEIVELLGLEDILESRPNEISGGEAQRTAIGRAILTSPNLLLLDEPFNAVDYDRRSEILKYIKKLNERLNIPILVISHDYDDLKVLTNRFYMIDRGVKGRSKQNVC